jgi:hypothetical protein
MAVKPTISGGIGGDRFADHVAERLKHGLERRGPDSLQPRQVAGGERPYRQLDCQMRDRHAASRASSRST